ncbi:unnamed protein product, partial [Mesorhabditis belari]|uniref:C2H2-type domain-containing protein n=1 Tax=Mesorhabditis belari TaxID=2138241 RepID=A0AAF3FDQ8_9BILA
MKPLLLIDEDSNDEESVDYQPQNNEFTAISALNWRNLDEVPVQEPFLCVDPLSELIPEDVPSTSSHFIPKNTVDPSIDIVFCMQCDLSIDPSSSLIGMESPHLASCSMKKELSCELCGAQYNKAMNLRVHLLLEHGNRVEQNDSKFACEICNRAFTRSKALQSHIEKHSISDELQCTRCRTMFTFKAELNRHLRWSDCAAEVIENQLVFCPHCSATIPFGEREIHARQHTILRRLSKKPTPSLPLPESFTKDRPHLCTICDKRFKRPAELKRHLNKHSGEKSFTCEQCERAYTHERGLLSHVQRDHNMKRYNCPICGVPFKSAQSMQRHAKAVHPLGQSQERRESYTCDICHCSFGNIGALSVHLKHQHDMTLPEHMRKVYVCPFCEKTFRKNRDCIDHIHSHTLEKRHRCKRCGKKFSSRNGLKVHMEIHLRQDVADPTLAMHRCGDCFKLLSSADALRRHRAIHQIYQCCRCGAKLQSAIRLRHHESICTLEGEAISGSLLELGETASQTFGSPSRPSTSRPASVGGLPRANFENIYTCRVCSLVLPTFTAWRTHSRTHSGRPTKPHICWLCHKAFSSIQQLHRHKQVHERERPMNCVVCQRSFRNRNRWLEHMAEAHPDVRTAEMPQEQRAGASSVQPYQPSTIQQFPQPTRSQSADMFYQNQQNDFYNLLPSTSGTQLFSLSDTLDYNQAVPITQPLPQTSAQIEPIAFTALLPYQQIAAPFPPTNLRCPVCQHQYQSAEHLLQHLDQISQESMHAFSIFTCPICQKSVSGCSAFAQHFRDGHQISLPNPSGFVDIPKAFLSQKTAKTRQKSEDIRVHRCSFCAKEFLRKSDIERHIRSHTGEKPFSCSICGRSFGNNYNLKVHEKSHERDGEKTHKCSVCQKSFFHMSALKLHMRKHTGDRPLKCPFEECAEMFGNSSARLRHIEWHNNGCPRALKTITETESPARGQVLSQLVSGSESTQQQFQRTVQQISRLKKQPLKIHSTSAFSVPPPQITVQTTEEEQILCVNVTPHEVNRYRIELCRIHRDPPHGTTHFCLPSSSLRVFPNRIDICKTTTVGICVSWGNALQALHENGLFPRTIICDISSSTDLDAKGRIVWVIALDTVPSVQAARLDWRRECPICDVTFTREEESNQHFTSEDHETAELTSSTRRGGIGVGPSLSAGVTNQEQLNYGAAHRGNFACQLCGQRLLDMELLLSHIHRFHNSETRGLETVRPAARTAPLH